jgi:hypothetical protein
MKKLLLFTALLSLTVAPSLVSQNDDSTSDTTAPRLTDEQLESTPATTDVSTDEVSTTSTPEDTTKGAGDVETEEQKAKTSTQAPTEDDTTVDSPSTGVDIEEDDLAISLDTL